MSVCKYKAAVSCFQDNICSTAKRCSLVFYGSSKTTVTVLKRKSALRTVTVWSAETRAYKLNRDLRDLNALLKTITTIQVLHNLSVVINTLVAAFDAFRGFCIPRYISRQNVCARTNTKCAHCCLKLFIVVISVFFLYMNILCVHFYVPENSCQFDPCNIIVNLAEMSIGGH